MDTNSLYFTFQNKIRKHRGFFEVKNSINWRAQKELSRPRACSDIYVLARSPD